MTEFVYNNTKNTSISHIYFKLNYGFHLYVFFKKDINFYLRFCLAEELTKELRDLILIYQQNLIYTQKLQKQAYNKDV